MSEEYIRRRMELARIQVEDDLDRLHPRQREYVRDTLVDGRPTSTVIVYRTPEDRRQLQTALKKASKGDRTGRVQARAGRIA